MIQTPKTAISEARGLIPANQRMKNAITEKKGVNLMYHGVFFHLNNGEKISFALGTTKETKKPIPPPITIPIPAFCITPAPMDGSNI